ncbi:hypothetical protein HAX54_032359 [Datura stramonium]|uniref:Uncharacterized protein n=1 Tax=Datura stramonium TaxID=4076 RepID=A0ABS8VBU1_DATST|nr:hypothetical protein [Datura stramonium]
MQKPNLKWTPSKMDSQISTTRLGCETGVHAPYLLTPIFQKLVCEFYASYKTKKQLLKHKGRIDTLPCLPSIYVRGLKVPIAPKEINLLYWVEPIQLHSIFCKKVKDKGNQFQWVANMIALGKPQWAMSKGLIHHRDLKFKAGMWIVCVDGMITLATKIDNDAPSMKRAKCTTRKTSPPPSASSTTSTTEFHPVVVPDPTPSNLLKIAQRAQVHESQLLKIAKSIPSMIQTAIKKVVQPAMDKLKSLCSTVEVL